MKIDESNVSRIKSGLRKYADAVKRGKATGRDLADAFGMEDIYDEGEEMIMEETAGDDQIGIWAELCNDED